VTRAWGGASPGVQAGDSRLPSSGRALLPGVRPDDRLKPGDSSPRGPDLPAETRRLVLERDGYACVCCGASVLGRPYSLQHRKRRSQGGGNSPSNLITVTTGCHARIGSRADPADEAKGYTCRGWQDPAGVPVMVFRPGGLGAAVWLADDGTCRLEPPEGRDAA
jgi:hypothetical protein